MNIFINSSYFLYELNDQLTNWYVWQAIFERSDLYDFTDVISTYLRYDRFENWFNAEILQTAQTFLYDVCMFDIFNYSVPNIKLYYPEPFIATPSYIHDDFWFIHIVIYQYWLWFFFISLIVFFFISFLVAVRWNNIRFRPGRETRGVSRSKCGDLITATVPVSWASSIIIHESTDAIEFYDGFGSTEMAVGIRAYQWGWEYYYPRNVDLLDWNDTKTAYIGNSIKYPVNNWNDINQNIFKNYSYLSNLNQNNSLSTEIWSNWNVQNTQLLQNTTFGLNKLINQTATSLITSPRVLNLTTGFQKLNTSTVWNHYWLYKKFAFTQLHTSQTTLNWNQFLLSSSYMLYNILIDSTIMYNARCVMNYFNSSDSTWLVWYELTGYKSILNLFRQTQIVNSFIANDSVTTDSHSFKFLYEYLIYDQLSLCNSFIFSSYAEQDFKQWSSFELLEDMVWDFFYLHKYFNKYFEVANISEVGFSSLFEKNKYFIQHDNSFFQDFSFVELTYEIPYQGSNGWDLWHYSKVSLLGLNELVWTCDSLSSSFARFKWNQVLVTLLSNNGYLLFTMNYKFLTVYELIYNFFILQFVNATSDTTSVFVSNLDKNFFWTNSNNWANSSKLFNTSNSSFWKVFKSSLQDERTLFNFKIFSNSYARLPYIENQQILLDAIQKNSFTFYKPTSFRNYFYYNDLALFNLDIVFNNFSFNFPFLTSTDSDIIRYLWFDWYTVRSTIITKAIDTSLYDLHGALRYNYNFVNQPLISLVNRTDNFFIKYMHARKLYIPFSIYSPYYYNKNFINNLFNELIFNIKSNVGSNSIQCLFIELSSWLDSQFIDLNRFTFFNSNLSFIMTQNHGFNLITALTNMVDRITQLNDILVKRNYLLSYLNTQLGLLYLPLTYQISLYNPLIQLFKNANTIMQVSRSESLRGLSRTIPALLNDYKVEYLLLDSSLSAQIGSDSLKNPYQPLRKGITNMIRIHADKAVAMPIDTRLQILAVSRDIIHSWAIPSAGIKIDCIPGYSSHRLVFFLLSGIYWGQCMEICGRFHHWMPIVVYFIRRDLFCIWCIHFIFTNKQLNMVSQSFESHNNYMPSIVSVTPVYWLYEL